MTTLLKNWQQKKNDKKQGQTMEERLNTIRAGILGSNDGILTVVGVVFSVAAATSNRLVIVLAGLSDLLACALSMGSGEFAAVSSQADSEKVAVALEKARLKTAFDAQMEDVAAFYTDRGVQPDTAKAIAAELLAEKPLATVLSVKYDMTLGHYVSPIAAAVSSTFSAALGGIFPLVALLIFPAHYQYLAAIVATVVASALTGLLSAIFSQGMVKRAIWRNIWVGLVTIAIHYCIGLLF
ncbi:VIT1/CCC1 transporter family protein [Fructobacillus fructosus]|uniref:VIT1/CCC1 transporter family protein n=1 Tax=Fructobacillus fructosus TaxID=1631 RepID=UPI00165897AB|nr:VIT family protein [Fructobacillus fructosus]MBC9118586.1 VIT family protein [Fructobacillus fructosus]MBD9365063.1 VIT family protein [Leuconostoc mesenteroides]